MKPEAVICGECGKPFTPRLPTSKYCSRDCYQTWWKANRTQIIGDKAGRKKREPEDDTQENAADEGELWRMRAEYWNEQAQDVPFDRRRVQQERRPLVLTGHGVNLRMERGSLLIKNGLTHHPQNRDEWRFFPGDLKMPSRIVLQDTDGSLTLDVIRWLQIQQVPVVVLDFRGEVISTILSECENYDVNLRRAQYDSLSNGKGEQIALWLIREKIQASLQTLKHLPASDAKKAAPCRLSDALDELVCTSGQNSMERIRLIEARAAGVYWNAWQSVTLKWKGTNRHPIPDTWHRFQTRNSPLHAQNKHAVHPMNALLNYAYALLESEVKIAATSAGLDLHVGYLHVCRVGRAALVYDLMEPMRPLVDAQVLQFAQKHTFAPADFPICPNGSCRLHPQMAKAVADAVLPSALIETISQYICQFCKNISGRG